MIRNVGDVAAKTWAGGALVVGITNSRKGRVEREQFINACRKKRDTAPLCVKWIRFGFKKKRPLICWNIFCFPTTHHMPMTQCNHLLVEFHTTCCVLLARKKKQNRIYEDFVMESSHKVSAKVGPCGFKFNIHPT